MSGTIVRCRHCGGVMKKSREAISQGSGCIIVILGILLAPVIIGIPIIIYGLHLAGKKRGLWVCKNCGYQFERHKKWYE